MSDKKNDGGQKTHGFFFNVTATNKNSRIINIPYIFFLFVRIHAKKNFATGICILPISHTHLHTLVKFIIWIKIGNHQLSGYRWLQWMRKEDPIDWICIFFCFRFVVQVNIQSSSSIQPTTPETYRKLPLGHFSRTEFFFCLMIIKFWSPKSKMRMIIRVRYHHHHRHCSQYYHHHH